MHYKQTDIEKKNKKNLPNLQERREFARSSSQDRPKQ